MSRDRTSQNTKQIIPTISRKEWGIVWFTIILVLLITTLPYLYAQISTPIEKQYMGIMLNVPDHVQYFSWMRELSDNLLASNKLTPERNQAIFHNLLWWMLGQAGRISGWNYVIMFQILRILATASFLLVAYRICSWFLSQRSHRITAFLLIIFASGFGWIIIVAKYIFKLTDLPLETLLLIFVVEPNTFFSILTTPHLVVASLYILVFELVLRGEVLGQFRYAIFAGIFALFLGFQHAYDLFLIYGILGAYGLLKVFRDRKIPLHLILTGLIIFTISFWPGLYSVLLTSLDPIWKLVLSQFGDAGVYTPSPLLLWILIGPTFFLALFTLFKIRFWHIQGKNDNTIFLIGWFLANFALLYIPTDFQIKMLNGWQVPLSLLSTIGLFRYVIPWLTRSTQKKKWSLTPYIIQTGLVTGFLLFVGLTNLYLWSWRFVDLGRHTYPYYLSQNEFDALKCLADLGNPEEAVLASLTIGQYIPAITGKYSFVAHWAQTVDYAEKLNFSKLFFDSQTDDSWRIQLINDYQINFIFHGPAERMIGDYQPSKSSYLEETTCRYSDAIIYRTK